ncbi:MAG: hypothetical protein AAB513_03300 [Patescibacteria group bacterium]
MQKFNHKFALKLGLNKKETAVLRKLNTPQKIQNYISGLKANMEKSGETLMSPRLVMKNKTCHCLESALFSSLALWLHGYEPLIVDMKAKKYDSDHCIAVFKRGGYWGAISKSNHAIIRFRDPIYKNLRELMMSYFHEFYIWNNGVKTLVSYSAPFNLKKIKDKFWIISKKNLWYLNLDKKLNSLPHFPFVLNKKIKLRPADKFERKVTKTTEYK